MFVAVLGASTHIRAFEYFGGVTESWCRIMTVMKSVALFLLALAPLAAQISPDLEKRVQFENKSMTLNIYLTPGGKYEQFLVEDLA